MSAIFLFLFQQESHCSGIVPSLQYHTPESRTHVTLCCGKRNHTAKGLHRESSYFDCNSMIKTAFVGHVRYVIVHIICIQYHVMFYQNSTNYAYSYTHFLGGKNRLKKLKAHTAKEIKGTSNEDLFSKFSNSHVYFIFRQKIIKYNLNITYNKCNLSRQLHFCL